MILEPVFEASYTFAILFGACEFCQRINNAFSEIDNVIGQINFYRFPIKIIRMLPIILMAAQQPVGFKCFGSIWCSRETFEKVCLIENHNVNFSSFN